MKKLGLMLAGALAMTMVGATAHATTSNGDYIFNFSGQCGDCKGQGTGTLQVQNYTLGSELTGANLVDFSYTSNLTSYDINPVDDFLSNDTLSGSITTAQGFYDINVASYFFGLFQTAYFTSSSDGTWSTGQANLDLDHGTNGLWNSGAVSAAPEPSTWALLMLGIGGIGYAFRRAKRDHGFRFKDALSA